MFSVYALIDPRYETVRYVGMTEDVYVRFSQHIHCNENNIEKNRWIQELKDLQQMVIMRTLETAETLEEIRQLEEKWIKHYLSQGALLLNFQASRSITFDEFMSFFEGAKKESKLPAQKESANTGMDDEKLLMVYPKVREWIDAGVRSVTVDKIADVSGHSYKMIRNRIKDGTIRKTKNPNMFRVTSVIEWLRVAPLPKQVEIVQQ